MTFIGVPSVRDEMTLPTQHANQFVDTHPLVRFQQNLFMWEFLVDFWRQNQETMSRRLSRLGMCAAGPNLEENLKRKMCNHGTRNASNRLGCKEPKVMVAAY